MEEYRLFILGTMGVGKTSLTFQITEEKFIPDTDPTIEDSYRKLLEIDKVECLLNLTDTVSEQEFCLDWHYRGGRGYVLMYAITSRASFEEVMSFRDRIHALKDKDSVPIILVGNKCDLQEERQVTKEEGQQLATRLGCSFIESSAKTRINVEEIFFNLVREINKENATQVKIICPNKKKTCSLM